MFYKSFGFMVSASCLEMQNLANKECKKYHVKLYVTD
jgi:hypothetical protein